ncbi:MAG TPA: hypothetical protein ENI23_01380 [bacterium]|nr:hypothetical protein [bacterium]
MIKPLSTTLDKPSDTLNSSPEDSQENLPQQQSSFPFASPAAIRKVLSFEDITALVDFYETIGWTPTMEFQLLVDIIQNTDNDNTRLRALKDLQARRREILEDTGLVIKATKVQKDADGGQTIFSTNIVSSALRVESNENRSETNVQQISQKKEVSAIPVKKRATSKATRKGRSVRANTSPRSSTGQFLSGGDPGPNARIIKDTDNVPQHSGGTTETSPDCSTGGGDATFHKPPTGDVILKGVTR